MPEVCDLKPGGRSRLAASMVVAVLLLAGALARAGSTEDVGFVLEARGKWQVASGSEAPRALVVGQSLKAGDKLLPGAPDDKATVVLLDGSRLSCPSDSRCAAPLAGKKADKPGFARRLVSAIGGLFSQPERYAATMSRGEELRESVGLVQKGLLDLSETLAALPKGTWRVTLQPIASGGDKPAVVGDERTDFEFDTSKPLPQGLPPARDLAPGLYRASLESGADAWVLVAAARDWKAKRRQFVEAQKVAKEFGKDVAERSSRSFLRAALDAIASGKVK